MSDAPTETTTETTTETKQDTPDNAPKWEGDFDPDRAARLVANLRAEVQRKQDALATANAKLTEYEQEKMSEQEKLAQRAEEAERERDELKRSLMVSEVVRKYGLPDDLAQFLSGDTAEEVEEKAKVLAEKVQPAKQSPPTKPQIKPVSGSGGEVDTQTQLTKADLANMSYAEIEAARRAGRLKNLLGGQ